MSDMTKKMSAREAMAYTKVRYKETLEYFWSQRACDAAEQVVELKAENARLREARDDAIDTLNAWFDRRKLAHEAIDDAVLDAARGYLRTSRSGGMPQHESDLIEGVIADMAWLSVFADLFARAAIEEKNDDE